MLQMQSTPPQADLLATLNAALSSCSIMLFILLAILALRDLRHTIQGRLLVLLCISACGLAFTLAPFSMLLPKQAHVTALVLGLPNLGLVWWFCSSLLKDDFKIGAIELGGFVALLCVPLVYFSAHFGVEFPLIHWVSKFGDIPAVLMIVHVAWCALSERSSDLVESRRHARLFLVFVPLVGLVIALFSEYLDSQHLASILRNGFGILPVQLVLVFWLFRMSPEQLQFNHERVAIPDIEKVDSKYVGLHQRLLEAMDNEQLYLNHGLTIEALAGKLRAPAHQLRYLINSNMGFRNFATFLNSYRLQHAKAALAKIERSRDSIVNIAFESGFASLPTFNRVFRESTGQTPTTYRAMTMSNDGQN